MGKIQSCVSVGPYFSFVRFAARKANIMMRKSWRIRGIPVRTDDGRFIPEVAELVQMFLESCSTKAAKSLAAEIKMAGADADKVPFAGRIAYWRHVHAASLMFSNWTRFQQNYYDEMSQEDIERIRRG